MNSGEPSTLQITFILLHQDPCADGLASIGSSDPVPSQKIRKTVTMHNFLQFKQDQA
jgi:hypothetical protein